MLGGGGISCGGFKFESYFVYKLKQENNKLNFKAENKFKHTQLFERKIYKLYFLIVFTYFFRALLSPQSMWYLVPLFITFQQVIANRIPWQW